MHEETPTGSGPTWHAPSTEAPETGPVAYDVPVAPVRRRGTGAVRAGIVAGVAALVVIGTAITMAAAPTTSDPGVVVAAASTAPSADPSASPAPAVPGLGKRAMPGGPGKMMGPLGFGNDGGWSMPGKARLRGGFAGPGAGAITITSVNGNDVGLKTDDGWTRTISVTDATTITKGGTTVKVGDLAVGDAIRFSQTRNSDGTYSINAIAVILPKVGGQVTATTADTITVTIPDGTSATIHVGSGTTYKVNGAKATLADIKAGMTLVAQGTKRSDGTLDATAIVAVNWNSNGRGFKGGPGHGPKTQASPSPSPASGTSG